MSRILIIDDWKDNVEALERELKLDNPDWEILTAGNETEGLRIVKEQFHKDEPVDVVLTDLVMGPHVDGGLTMLREARAIDPQIMGILFTAQEQSLDRFAAFESGAFDVVEKTIRGRDAGREINIKTRAALRYREWSQRINFLRRYFDPKLFDKFDSDPNILRLSQRLVTICFWDIRGFSGLCEILRDNPDMIAGFLKDYFSTAAQTIFKYDGILDKFIGDGVMAIFGLFGSGQDDGTPDAVAAVRSAIELNTRFQVVLDQWMQRWLRETNNKIEIGLGCGINTGRVLVGNVGTSFRDQFTALGPHVNFTARIEARAGAGQVLVSQATYARVKGVVGVRFVEEFRDIKNIPGIYKIYEVYNEAPDGV